jgi:heat-inducible transcriptional repressor
VLVARHIRDGQPVGSRTLHEEAGLPLSPATIRNVMSDLEERGFLHSPHTSAGRVPTALGYRFFVDSLLQVRQLDELRGRRCAANCTRIASSHGAGAERASPAVVHHSQAGVVTVPRPSQQPLRQIEFLPLSGDRVLAILVVNQREVQNRIIHTRRVFSEEELREAAALINAALRRATSSATSRQALAAEIWRRAASIDDYLEATLDLAKQALDEDAGARTA